MQRDIFRRTTLHISYPRSLCCLEQVPSCVCLSRSAAVHIVPSSLSFFKTMGTKNIFAKPAVLRKTLYGQKLNFDHKNTLPLGKLSNCLHSVNYCIWTFTNVNMFANIGNEKLIKEGGMDIPLSKLGYIILLAD